MRSPALKVSTLEPFDIGFRVINDHYINTDTQATRIDIKILDKQYSVGFISSSLVKPKKTERTDNGVLLVEGIPVKPDDDMLTPTKVDACLNVKANKQAILDALKELVNDIEKDM